MSTFPDSLITQLTAKPVRNMADQVGSAFKNAPHFPKGLVDFLVSIAPWLVGLGGVVGAFSGLSMVLNGLGFGVSVWMQLAGITPLYYVLVGVLQLVSAGLLLMAFSPLRERRMTGWLLLFVNMGVGIVQSVVGLLFSVSMMGVGSLLWIAVSAVIGAYILFELRGQYKD